MIAARSDNLDISRIYSYIYNSCISHGNITLKLIIFTAIASIKSKLKFNIQPLKDNTNYYKYIK